MLTKARPAPRVFICVAVARISISADLEFGIPVDILSPFETQGMAFSDSFDCKSIKSRSRSLFTFIDIVAIENYLFDTFKCVLLVPFGTNN